MAQGEERSAPAQDLDASSSTCAVEENGEASAEKGTGQGEGGPSYGFLTSLPSSEAESIQAQIMRQLEVIMVGQRGGGGPGEAGEEETSIQEDLSVLNEYVWHLLTQEVANQERLKKELLEFLQTNTEPFVTWLHEVLSRRDPSGAMLMAPVGGGAKGGDMVDDGAVTPRSRPLEGEEEATGVREKSYERDGRRRSRESSSRHESSRHRDQYHSSHSRRHHSSSSHYHEDERRRRREGRDRDRDRDRESRRDDEKYRSSRRRRHEEERSSESPSHHHRRSHRSPVGGGGESKGRHHTPRRSESREEHGSSTSDHRNRKEGSGSASSAASSGGWREKDDFASTRSSRGAGGASSGQARPGRLLGLAVEQAAVSTSSGGGLNSYERERPKDNSFTSAGILSRASHSKGRSRSRSRPRLRAVVLVSDEHGVRRVKEIHDDEEEQGEILEGDGSQREGRSGSVTRSPDKGNTGTADAGGAKPKAILRPNPRYQSGPVGMPPSAFGPGGDPSAVAGGFVGRLSPQYPPNGGGQMGGAGYGGLPSGAGNNFTGGSGEMYPGMGVQANNGRYMPGGAGPGGAMQQTGMMNSGSGGDVDMDMSSGNHHHHHPNSASVSMSTMGGVNGEGVLSPGVLAMGGGTVGGAPTAGDGGMATGVPPMVQGKVRKRCIKWPRCPFGANCMFIHPTAKCTKWPRCAFGDACFYWHPMVPCKFGPNCVNPFCNYTHEPVDPAVAAAAASAIAAAAPASTGTSPTTPGASATTAAGGADFLGTLGEHGFYMNKTWTPDDKDSSENAVNAETAAAEKLKSSVEALSNTLPGTPPELRRRREEEVAASAALSQADGENEMRLPPATQDISTEEVPAREEQEGVMEG